MAREPVQAAGTRTQGDLRDTGLLHTLLCVRNLRDLQAHSKLGASWEGFVIAVGHAVDAFGPH